MIELVTYAIVTFLLAALGTAVAAFVAGFVAYWIAYVAALGWHLAAELHKR